MTKEQVSYIHSIIGYSVWPSLSVDVASFIACQFALESNFGRSLLARKFHNHCGMKPAYKRLTYRNADECQFAHYDSVEDCVLDYISWLSYNHFTQGELYSVQGFKSHLCNSGYCPEKDYINKIQSIYNQFKSQKNGN